ncbi:unnamed protein product [Cunninghamella blakesleeana]
MIMERLPPELLHYIFYLINPIGMKEVALVCKNWLLIARPYIYHTIQLDNSKQTKNFISILQYIGRELEHRMRESDFISLQHLCPFVEYIDPNVKSDISRLPVWFQIRCLNLTLHGNPNKTKLYQEWCRSRGSQLTQLITTANRTFCEVLILPTATSTSMEFTLKILTIPHQYEHLQELEFTTLHTTETEIFLPLGSYLLKIVHDACPNLNTFRILNDRLLMNDLFSEKRHEYIKQIYEDDNIIFSNTYQQIDEYNMMILTHPPPTFGCQLRHLSFVVHPFISTDVFKFFKWIYPMIDTLTLYFHISYVNNEFINITPGMIELMGDFSQDIYEMITEGFINLKTLNVYLSGRDYLYNHFWPHDRIIQWLDDLHNSNINKEDDGDDINLIQFGKQQENQTNRHQMIRSYHFTIENDYRGAYNEAFNVGNGNWFKNVQELTVNAHMILSRTVLNNLFHGRKNSQFLYMTTLRLNNTVDKKIVLDILLFVCPSLKILEIRQGSLKPRFALQPRSIYEMTHHQLKYLELKNCNILDNRAFQRILRICHRLTTFIGHHLFFEDDLEVAMNHRLPTASNSYSAYEPVSKYTFEQYYNAQPIIEINLPHHYLEYVSLSSITYLSSLVNRYSCMVPVLLVDQLSYHHPTTTNITINTTQQQLASSVIVSNSNNNHNNNHNNNNNHEIMATATTASRGYINISNINNVNNENVNNGSNIINNSSSSKNSKNNNNNVNNDTNNNNNNNNSANINIVNNTININSINNNTNVNNDNNNNNNHGNNNLNNNNNNNNNVNNNNNNGNQIHQRRYYRNGNNNNVSGINNSHNNNDNKNRLMSNQPGIKVYETGAELRIKRTVRVIQNPRSYIKFTCKHLDEIAWH